MSGSKFLRRLYIVFALVSFVSSAIAEEMLFAPIEAGFRSGISAPTQGGKFVEAEGYVDWKMPWYWRWPENYHWQLCLESALGYLGAYGDDTIMGELGPNIIIRREGWRVSLEAGSNLTILGRHKFAEKDLGDNIQFTTHAGLNIDLTEHLAIGYRFQHISNAGLSEPNPGLNIHLIAITYVF